MKTALLHYWLTNMRGGENVFREICGMFPDGDVYTHALGPAMRDREEVEKVGGGGQWCGHLVTESFIARLPFGRKWPQAYLPLMPMASRGLKLDGYDLIISSESGLIKGIRKPAGAKHICYCHTPMRYLWDMYEEYYRMAGLGGKIAMRAFRDCLRKEDLKSADSVDVFVANSKFVADRIKRIYGREAEVVYPMVDFDFFSHPSSLGIIPRPSHDYYLLAGQLIPYKRPDLAVAACLRMGRKLKVVGTGNQIEKLKTLAAGSTDIEFLGRVSNENLRTAYANAKALLFPGVEDFGIVPLEAQAAGTPVIAYGVGGALETVVNGSTGLFFGEQTVDSLCGAIEEFETKVWSPDVCRMQAVKFSRNCFLSGMSRIINRVLESDGLPTLAHKSKIIVATHKPYWMPTDPVYLPVQVGAADKEPIGFQRDDGGENISVRNPNWCELTGLYWAWKNKWRDEGRVNGTSAVGLVHYRRHFRGKKGALSGAEIEPLLKDADAILPKKRNYFIETNYSQYAHAHHAIDLATTREILAERCPEYVPFWDASMKSTKGHRFNMFIMKRDLADRYCEWLFDILFELERRLDISSYSKYDARIFGFMSERLLDPWLAKNGVRYVEVSVWNLESQHWGSKIVNFVLRKVKLGGKQGR